MFEEPTSNNKKEVTTDDQLWYPASGIGINKAGSIFQEIAASAALYSSPLTVRDRLLLKVREKLAGFDAGQDFFVFENVGYQTPRQWHAIIQYLYEAGVISHPKMQYEPIFNDEPKIYSLRLRPVSSEGITDGRVKHESYSRGVSRELNEAISKAIGELLERYPLSIYRSKDLFRASVRQLRNKGLRFFDPFLMAGFSEAQKEKFPNRCFDETSMFYWVRGKSLTHNTEAFIPAQIVFWNYRLVADEPFLQQPITNGAAGMFTRESAVLAGLYELIQRDAFLIFWLNKIAPPRIDPASIRHQETVGILRDLERYKIRAEILDVTSDFGVPAFVAALLDTSPNGPALSVGGGCDPNPELAILRALTEAIGIRHWLRTMTHNGVFALPKSYKPFSIPLGQRERLRLWANRDMRQHFEFFLKGPMILLAERHPPKESVSQNKDELLRLARIFKGKGDAYEIFYYETNHPVLRVLGYHSVSAAVPAILPLYLNETCAPLVAERIREVPKILGYDFVQDVNPLPHPFP